MSTDTEIRRGAGMRLSTSAQQQLALTTIRRDGGTQPRAGLSEDHILRLVEALDNGESLPAITVFYDGEAYWLADGFHRCAAAMRHAGSSDSAAILAEVRQGDRRAAVLHSVGANRSHGLPRSRDDLRRAIETLLRDEEWARWSDREIARQVGCSPTTVGALRSKLDPSVQLGQIDEGRIVSRNGTTYTQAPKAPPYRPANPAPRNALAVQDAKAAETRLMHWADRAVGVGARLSWDATDALLQHNRESWTSSLANEQGLQSLFASITRLEFAQAHNLRGDSILTRPDLDRWAARASAVGANLAYSPDYNHTSLRLPTGTLIISAEHGASDLVAHIKRLEQERTALPPAPVEPPALPPAHALVEPPARPPAVVKSEPDSFARWDAYVESKSAMASALPPPPLPIASVDVDELDEVLNRANAFYTAWLSGLSDDQLLMLSVGVWANSTVSWIDATRQQMIGSITQQFLESVEFDCTSVDERALYRIAGMLGMGNA